MPERLEQAADGELGNHSREPGLVAIAHLAEDWWYAFVPETHGDLVAKPLDLMMGASVRSMSADAPLVVRKSASRALFSILGNVDMSSHGVLEITKLFPLFIRIRPDNSWLSVMMHGYLWTFLAFFTHVSGFRLIIGG